MTSTPPVWTLNSLQREAERAVDIFRKSRDSEPVDLYLEFYEAARNDVEDVMELTVDLDDLVSEASVILSSASYRYVMRYLVGPAISEDDLRTSVGKQAYDMSKKGQNPGAARVIDFLAPNIDRRRFPWRSESRHPMEAEREAAVIATAALMANQKAQTARRTGAKVLQETRVMNALREVGFREVRPRTVNTPSRAPGPGEFCGESMLVGQKADLLVGLWDERLLAIECKTSNSEVNSFKRVNHEAGGKAAHWTSKFGQAVVVPAVTLSGVFRPQNLLDAQSGGLTIWWSHGLKSMIDWIETTR